VVRVLGEQEFQAQEGPYPLVERLLEYDRFQSLAHATSALLE
jgi:hypothetical protein